MKVCGREEYIKISDVNNKIISLNYIRNCIRKNEVNNLELVLLYDDSLNTLNDSSMRKALRNSYNRYYYENDVFVWNYILLNVLAMIMTNI